MNKESKTKRSRPASRAVFRDETSASETSKERTPHPLFDLHLLGLKVRWVDRLVTLVLLSTVVITRVAAFPGSIWDQDEAYFATAIMDFDPTENHPHPPWFPLWIVLGKVVHALGPDPAAALQIVSALFGCWMLFPLASMWAGILGRRLGVVAALFFLFLPGPWLLAGRAYSGTAASALFVAALAFWIGRREDRWSAHLGGAFAGLSVLVRPHFLPATLVALFSLGRKRASSRILPAWLIFGTVVALGFTSLVVASSGLGPLTTALEKHSAYHFGALPDATLSFSESGLVRCLLNPTAALLWIILAVAGSIVTMRASLSRPASMVLTGALLAILLIVIGGSDPVHARYFIPVLAMSSGFVVAAATAVSTPFAIGLVVGSVLLSITSVLPQLSAYRTEICPPMLAIESAVQPTDNGSRVLVVDHTLISFVKLAEARRGAFPPVIYDNQIEAGKIPPPPPNYSLAVYAEGHDHHLTMARGRQTFSCTVPVLRTIELGRFLDVTVSTNPVFEGWVDDGKPYIVVDGD